MVFLSSKWSNPLTSLRNLTSRGTHPVVGVYNPYSALLAQHSGFKVIYLSGAAYSGSLAMPDLGLISLDELLFMVRAVTRAANVPLIVDADTGFGEALNVVRTARELERAGTAAIQIEDQEMPKKCGHLEGKRVVDPVVMVQKIKAIVQARRTPDFLIVARTDARSTHGLEEAIDRANLYLDTGADIIFPEALESANEFKRFAKKVDAPLLANMTEFGKSPLVSVSELAQMGYRFVLFPVTLFRVASQAIIEAAKTIMKEGSQKSLIPRMQTREEFYELISYWAYEQLDQNIGKTSSDLVSGRRKGAKRGTRKEGR